MELDRTDYAILAALQENGRISTVDLAERIGLSATPCAARVKRLQRDGVIEGYHARLSALQLGYRLLAFVQVKLRSTDEKTLEAFNRTMHSIIEVLECHMVGGGFDYLVKVRARDMNHYRAFHSKVIGAIDSVENTHSYFVMQEVKETGYLPLAPASS